MQALLASPFLTMSGMSYNEFYPSPLWTHHNYYHHQPYPVFQQQAVQPALVAFPQQYPHPAILPPIQLQQTHVNEASNQPIRRKRASKPKVRTGCTTCKVSRAPLDFCSSLVSFQASKPAADQCLSFLPTQQSSKFLTLGTANRALRVLQTTFGSSD